MDSRRDTSLDSPSKNSYIGSYYQPPATMSLLHRGFPSHPPGRTDETPRRQSQSTRNINSRAVVEALKTLQEKIRRLELERNQTESTFRQLSQDAQKHQDYRTSQIPPTAGPSKSAPTSGGMANHGGVELNSKLNSCEARCKVLEKQLEYMRRMVECAQTDGNVSIHQQVYLEDQETAKLRTKLTEREKLDKLESEYLKLSKTQTLSEAKLASLEKKLLKEERERKLVQKKADVLQREFDNNVKRSNPADREKKQKKKSKRRTPKKTERTSVTPKETKAPFFTGTSTSPSHSVHANVQTVLFMMKQHHPQLCERVSALQHHHHGQGTKKPPQKNQLSTLTTAKKVKSFSSETALSSLSDLLMNLQDELGHMSFEHQELMRQIRDNQSSELNEVLQSDLKKLAARMEEKESQISKLRKHQQTVNSLRHTKSHDDKQAVRRWGAPAPPTIRVKRRGKKNSGPSSNLQLLKESQKLRIRLEQGDISWET